MDGLEEHGFPISCAAAPGAGYVGAVIALLAFVAHAHAAEPYLGVEWRPLSRADLTWVQEDRTSGLAVGEFDGSARPNLQAYGGAWVSPRLAVGGALGIARLQNSTELDGIVRQRHWGVLRPSLDFRVALAERGEQRALPWVIAGLHLDVPSVRDNSSGYTPEEQAVADEATTFERARLAGFGGRLGIGADYAITPGISLGAMYTLQWHRGIFRADDLRITSQWLAGEAALLLQFQWPRRPGENEAR